MVKDNYDDMTDRPSKRSRSENSDGKPSKGILWTVALGIAICVVVIVLWYRIFPNDVTVSAPPVQTENVFSTETQVEVIADAPAIDVPTSLAPVITPTSVGPSSPDSIVLDNQAKAFGDIEKKIANTKTVQYEEHVVGAGEDLNSIADLYSLKTQTLISVNQIRNVQAVIEGTVLRVPDRDGQLYTVREGDMLSTIARKYNPGLGWKTLQELNGLSSENIIVGQKIFIPDVSTPALSQMADVATIQFQSPANGVVTLLFGQPYQNPANGNMESSLGILISGKPGTAVVAAAAGNVVDAGYEAKGKGRFVVISHEGGYRTTYTHMENVEVKIGTKVAKGETIGSIGTSGTDYDKPTLFFSIEQSGIFLDPSQFF
ncbi:membrane-bound metallopeptidase [Sphaerochaeta pleomorpha str. Grapes]|uniref:Membrane-bound metallopeptidase n=1 Tax=Sphaerochaeta pleomorpha (strain ATCC BAA-1885 / DSM 22778 / Grapes) TaxID=158190 RepID=G8QXC9_SPHPG|nr:peptidoglycan DD-metalloendopeptidase family protein [Sphaerochaeta pleomorpha]AEV28430.1 membrane-bound metallopeptidase [Sphaerochaeta pleomorpha str. Grapes]